MRVATRHHGDNVWRCYVHNHHRPQTLTSASHTYTNAHWRTHVLYFPCVLSLTRWKQNIFCTPRTPSWSFPVTVELIKICPRKITWSSSFQRWSPITPLIRVGCPYLLPSITENVYRSLTSWLNLSAIYGSSLIYIFAYCINININIHIDIDEYLRMKKMRKGGFGIVELNRDVP